MSPSNLAAYPDRNARSAATDAETDVSEIPFIPFRQECLITGVGPCMEPAAAVDLELRRRQVRSNDNSPHRLIRPVRREELGRSFAAPGGYDEQTCPAPTQTGAITEDPTSATERWTGKNEGRKER